jgi:hypothetical protein
MKTPPDVGYFAHDEFAELISKIHTGKNKTKKEVHYKEIARSILKSTGIADSIIDGPSVTQMQGVPFDFIGFKNSDVYIIELKGSDQNLNFPSEVQLRRMEDLIEQLKVKYQIELKPLLFQINLQYCIYCICPCEFLLNRFKSTNKKLGIARKIKPIADWVKTKLPDQT